MSYHDPVLLHESVAALNIEKDGVFVDATFGGGGHSRHILEQLGPNGKLLSFDQDADAAANSLNDPRFHFVPANFRYLKRFLRLNGVKQVNGILADLGVSSHQFNEAERGFSYRFDAELDMRMDQQAPTTAADILNQYNENELIKILSEYGEVRNSKTLAKAIVDARRNKKFRTIQQFLNAIEHVVRGNKARYLAQVFQALRIEVNEEMEVLKEFLEQCMEVLKPNGRLSVISYHSLEDRLVKNFMKKGNFKGEFIKDDYGNIFRPFKLIVKKAIEPPAEEIKRNPRARSAKLRIAEKI